MKDTLANSFPYIKAMNIMRQQPNCQRHTLLWTSLCQYTVQSALRDDRCYVNASSLSKQPWLVAHTDAAPETGKTQVTPWSNMSSLKTEYFQTLESNCWYRASNSDKKNLLSVKRNKIKAKQPKKVPGSSPWSSCIWKLLLGAASSNTWGIMLNLCLLKGPS